MYFFKPFSQVCLQKKKTKKKNPLTIPKHSKVVLFSGAFVCAHNYSSSNEQVFFSMWLDLAKGWSD